LTFEQLAKNRKSKNRKITKKEGKPKIGNKKGRKKDDLFIHCCADTTFLPASGIQNALSISFTHDRQAVANQNINYQVEV
jgi:hypothetical protein